MKLWRSTTHVGWFDCRQFLGSRTVRAEHRQHSTFFLLHVIVDRLHFIEVTLMYLWPNLQENKMWRMFPHQLCVDCWSNIRLRYILRMFPHKVCVDSRLLINPWKPHKIKLHQRLYSLKRYTLHIITLVKEIGIHYIITYDANIQKTFKPEITYNFSSSYLFLN